MWCFIKSFFDLVLFQLAPMEWPCVLTSEKLENDEQQEILVI